MIFKNFIVKPTLKGKALRDSGQETPEKLSVKDFWLLVPQYKI